MDVPFTMVPNAVLFDTGLSFGARCAYMTLAALARQAGRRNEADPPVELPDLDTVAAALGASRTALKGYLVELRKVGVVITVRVKHQGMVYAIFDSAAGSDSDLAQRRARADSDLELGRILTQPRARVSDRGSSRAKEKSEYGETDVSPAATESVELPVDLPAKAPRLTKVETRNLPMDALADETGTDPAGGRVGELNAALNGRPGQPGIRDQFWRECVRRVELDPRLLPTLLEAAGTDRWEKSLASAVRRKAALYRAKMPGANLTPTALRKWWTDLERMPDQRPGAGGVTPAEIRARGRAA